MRTHLSQADQQGEDMCVVVEHGRCTPDNTVQLIRVQLHMCIAVSGSSSARCYQDI